MLKNTFLDNKTNTMTLKKMGSRYPSLLSFARSMIRTMLKEKWKIKCVKFNLDKNGYGCAIYEVLIKKKIYSLVCFSQYLEDKERLSELKIPSNILDDEENCSHSPSSIGLFNSLKTSNVCHILPVEK